MAAQQKINIAYQRLNGRTQSRTPQVSGPLGTLCSGAKTSCSSLFPVERAVFCHYSEHSGQRLILTQTPLNFHIVAEKRGIQEMEGKAAVHPIKLVQIYRRFICHLVETSQI